MTAWPTLDVVIPYHPSDEQALQRLLASFKQQTYPQDRLRFHVIREGNSEEAKAIGISQCRSDCVALVCCDNQLVSADFLEVMVDAALQEGVVGAYTSHYAYVKEDTSLSRYFALLGANDPLCWWLGKADRASYLSDILPTTRIVDFSQSPQLPSLGDNGCFYKRALLQSVVHDPKAFGSLMCICADLRQQGYARWAIVPTTIWHRTGESFWHYLRRRHRYVDQLYFAKRALRRWHLVATLRDWLGVVLFALASLLVVPQVLLSFRGARQVKDVCWAWHPVVCFSLTLLYAWGFLKHLWSSVRLTERRN